MSERLNPEDFPDPELLHEAIEEYLKDLPEGMVKIFSGNVTVEEKRYEPFDNGFEVPVP